MRLVLLGSLIVQTALVAAVRGDDWPQWMGPRRDNEWREDGILDTFPAEGPRVLWRTPIAGGYAGPAVAGGRIFVTDYATEADVKVANFERKTSTGTERVLCLDETTGKILWKHEYPVTYTIAYPAGPRCTPTVDGERVYTLGAEGDLFCFEAATGNILWSRDLKKDYATKAALWGWASHPLVDGGKLMCIAGTDTAHAVALDTRTGKEIWRAGKAPEQGYVPPSIIEAAGVRQLILVKPDGVYAVDPETGKLLWETPYNADNGSIIMTPVRIGEHLYIGGYQNKNLLLKLKGDTPGVDVVWRNKPKQGISAVNVQPFVADGLVYGFHESGELRALRIPEGDFAWRGGGPLGERPQGSGTAFITRHGDRFFLFTEAGDLVIAKLTPTGYEELSRTHLIEPTNVAFGRPVVWCQPAYANRSVVVRNDAEIIRVSLAK
ncbi:MAG: pyrrolo-quinoline quinone [Planctomycetia bacterium]|nr:pyrrolo-quinoline quinone [Planctomycetia bacterium]